MWSRRESRREEVREVGVGVEEVEGQEGIITPQDKGLLILWVMNDLERQRLGFDFAGVKGV